MIQVEPMYGLYPYQRQVLHDLLAILAPDGNRVVPKGHRVVAHMPTGSGKTRLACYAACHTLNLFDSAGKLVIWLASTEELCQQASDDLAQAWSYLGNRTVDIHEFWGEKPIDLTKISSGFLVAGLPRLWATARYDHTALTSLANAAALVIFDEAHQAIARTYRFITEQLVAYQPPLLGLTATPGRTAEINDEDQELAELFHFNKVTIDARGHPNPVAYLTTQGFLADPEFTHVDTQSGLYVEDPINTPDYSNEDLNRIGEDEAWQQAITNTTITALKRHNRVMVFCPSVRNVAACAERINAQGFTGRNNPRHHTNRDTAPHHIQIQRGYPRSHSYSQLRCTYRRFQRTPHALRHHRKTHHIAGAILADGRACHERTALRWEPDMPDLHHYRF